MQQPTLANVHIRTVQDAHKLFYAVQLGLLPKIEKRLNAQERNALRPGNVYVWEERAPTTDSFSVSMERFTEGRSWTASRVREDFLVYFENPRKVKGRNDAQRARSSENQVVRPGEQDLFIKQTYSVYRDDPAELSKQDEKEKPKKPRKWHVNAYFTKLTEGQLKNIDDIPMLRDMHVPEGIFVSARTNKPGKKGETRGTSSGVKRTFAPFPSSAPPRRVAELSQPVASTSTTTHLPFPSDQTASSSSPEPSSVGLAPTFNAAVQPQQRPQHRQPQPLHQQQQHVHTPGVPILPQPESQPVRPGNAEYSSGAITLSHENAGLQIRIPKLQETGRRLSSGSSISLPSFPPHPPHSLGLHALQSIDDFPGRERHFSFNSVKHSILHSPSLSISSHSSPASWHSSIRRMSISPSVSYSDSHSQSMSPPQPTVPLIESEWGPANAPVPVLDDGTPYTRAPGLLMDDLPPSSVPALSHSIAMAFREEREDPRSFFPAVAMDIDPPPVRTASGGEIGASPEVGLAPLHTLTRSQHFGRSPTDDRTLRLLGTSPA